MRDILLVFTTNLPEAAAVVLFGIGLGNLILAKNLIRKIIGLNIMDSSVYLFLAAKGYIAGRLAPVIDPSGPVDTSLYIDPIPTGLVLTGIVVSVSVTAFLLALTVRLYERFGTIDIDQILIDLKKIEKQEDEEWT